MVMSLEMLNYIAKIVAISANSVENQYSSVLQRIKNKQMHTMNGNRHKNPNVKSHLKIAQINKGNSNFTTKLTNILSLIDKEKPDILMVSEANMEEDHPCVRNHLKGYNVEIKLLGEMKVARMIVLIKADITYERIREYENNTNAMITLKIKNSARNSIFLVCVYRQWKLLHTKDDLSNLPINQLKRFELILGVISQLVNEGREILLIGDINIDLWPPNNPGHRKDIKALHELYTSVINQLGLCQQNFKPTRYQSNASPSLLDHVFCSHPQKINSVETKLSIIADHCLVKCQYHARTLRQRPQFKRVRDHKLLNSQILMEHVGMNARLQSIFQFSDPDYIAETLIAEVNRILEDISPSRVIQCNKSYEPWKTRETVEVEKTVEHQLEKAIDTGRIEEWRYFLTMRNHAHKLLEFAKRSFYIERFTMAGNIWREFRQFQGEHENNSPLKIVCEGKEVSSPKKLSNMFNDYFIRKIEDIQLRFNNNDNDQLKILAKVIKRPESTLEIESVSVNEMYEAITRMKTSNSCGFDQIS